MADRAIIGWDIGGAHVKASLLRRGLLHDVAQWPCPLWQGGEHLDRVLALARERWPDLGDAQHAVTMTGEMVDRLRIAKTACSASRSNSLPPCTRRSSSPAMPAGATLRPRRRCGRRSPRPTGSRAHAIRPPRCRANRVVLVDIGSTTTDLIAFRGGSGADQEPQRRAAAGQRRARLPGRGAYTAVRAGPPHRLARRAAECDERVLRHHGRRLSPHRRTRPGARPAPERRPRGQGPGRDLRATGAHDRTGCARRQRRASGWRLPRTGARNKSPSCAASSTA